MSHCDRLGFVLSRDRWPTPAALKGIEAAGFGWVSVAAPPGALLADRERCRRHARALRAVLRETGLRLVVRGPGDLAAGTRVQDAAFDGLLDHAREAGATHVTAPALRHPRAERPTSPARRAAEARSLHRLAARADALGVTIALANTAPDYPAADAARLGDDVLTVARSVRAIGSPALGMHFDVGHANITVARDGRDVPALLRAVASEVVLVAVHDNLGARRHDVSAPGVDPLRLDLHLPPGTGTVPWDGLAESLRTLRVPLLADVAPAHRPPLRDLAGSISALLERGSAERTLAA